MSNQKSIAVVNTDGSIATIITSSVLDGTQRVVWVEIPEGKILVNYDEETETPVYTPNPMTVEETTQKRIELLEGAFNAIIGGDL